MRKFIKCLKLSGVEFKITYDGKKVLFISIFENGEAIYTIWNNETKTTINNKCEEEVLKPIKTWEDLANEFVYINDIMDQDVVFNVY